MFFSSSVNSLPVGQWPFGTMKDILNVHFNVYSCKRSGSHSWSFHWDEQNIKKQLNCIVQTLQLTQNAAAMHIAPVFAAPHRLPVILAQISRSDCFFPGSSLCCWTLTPLSAWSLPEIFEHYTPASDQAFCCPRSAAVEFTAWGSQTGNCSVCVWISSYKSLLLIFFHLYF